MHFAEMLKTQLCQWDKKPCFVTAFNSTPGTQIIAQFQSLLKYQFNNEALVLQALSHRSFIHEIPENFQFHDNERLEFLGDSLLGTYVSTKLFRELPSASEGELSKLRGAIVNEKRLYELSKIINLSEYILVGRGELSQDGHLSSSKLSDTFEAIIAAIYLDSNIQKSFEFLDMVVGKYQDSFGDLFTTDILFEFDPKSMLQEQTMALYKELPVYQVEEKDEVDSKFFISVLIKGTVVESGHFSSKKKGTAELAKSIIEGKKYLNI
ncbi:MAG: ribonuclease III [Bacteriovoracaceae bacterium]|jgi:ribonuclease III|nr:ribonuclease III [Bacteriovoracaceae bacterium]